MVRAGSAVSAVCHGRVPRAPPRGARKGRENRSATRERSEAIKEGLFNGLHFTQQQSGGKGKMERLAAKKLQAAFGFGCAACPEGGHYGHVWRGLLALGESDARRGCVRTHAAFLSDHLESARVETITPARKLRS